MNGPGLLMPLYGIAFLLIQAAFWPYAAGIAIFAIGLTMLLRSGAWKAQGLDKAIAFGGLFFAVPLAVFGGDHFVFSRDIAGAVPSWIPGHLFWVYFVGTALFAAALSIVVNRYSALAATLSGLMIFSFVLLISVPRVAGNLGDRFAWAVLLRDLFFSGGGLAFAVAQAKKPQDWSKLIAVIRTSMGIVSVIFGIEHFLHPQFVPVVPLKQLMPPWIPGHVPLAFATGAVMIASGLCIVLNWKARMAATALGIVVFVIVVQIYLPIAIAKLSDIGNGLNYVADTLLFSGSALLLAGALPKDTSRKVRQRASREGPFSESELLETPADK